MIDLGLTTRYLGLELKQGIKGILAYQRAYIHSFLKKSGMKGCNVVSTPLQNNLKLNKEIRTLNDDPITYRSLVKKLIFLTNT
jgi:hypothetical protein